ncbi:hypothetical protein LTR94_012770 [Friedmanniomyces endolithicus]|nr:hypothetical protein LTR94_012770 [Friedmanniomyces endolithicus]
MIYGEEASAGKSVVVVDVEKQERQQFALNDHELQELAKQALIIENHYGSPMDIEWAKDGDDGQIYIVQARPETVKSRENVGTMERYLLKQKGTVICEGRSIGQRIGSGFIYEGSLDFEIQTNSIESMPELQFKVMMNVGNPDRAFDFAQIPNEGIGLARLEFIINRMIGVHPKALLNIDSLPRETRAAVMARTAGYASPIEFYVEKLVEGISTLAAAFADKPVIVRMSDFKSNEYANLIGGKLYEPEEENPMLGFRGASRYVSDNFRDCFELECRALKKARDEMGLTNIQIMIPFTVTLVLYLTYLMSVIQQ